MAEPQPVHFVIAGGGSAGWIAAAVLARFLPPPAARISLVESEDIGIIGVGEATVPLIGELNRFLGIHEPDFVAATNGTFKLGIEFADWGEIGNRHFHGFGDYGADIAGLPVHQHWLRLAREGKAPPLGALSIAEVLASQDRFVPHEALSGEAAQFRHAFHFDAALYAAYLRHLAEGMGVTRIEGRIEHVARDAQNGHVRALHLDGDRRIEGDVFLDCTGFASLLLGQAQGVGFEDWSQWLPCDRAAAVPCARASRFTPFTRSTAKSAGWQWRIPLQNRTGNGHVYSSAHISDDEAVAQLLDGLDGEALADPRLLRFTPGRRTRFWDGNVIAIGLAAGFLEPLESTAIQLIQTGVTRLVEFLPGKAPDPALAAEYNRQTALEYERIRDFIIAHYCRTRRTEPLWCQVAAMDLPDTLRAKLDAWDACGRVPMYDMESHQEPSWVAILLGQGVLPHAVNPRTQLLAEKDLRALLDQRRTRLARATERLPDHATFIAKTCAAKPAPAA